MSLLITRLLTLLLLAKATQQQKLEPIICDCGFVDEGNNNWAGIWHADFSTYKEDIHVDLNYAISAYTVPAKHKNTFDRIYTKSNAEIRDGALQLSVTNENGQTRSGAISTDRDDFLYGSFRAYIKTTTVPGTVAAFYLYKNDTSEIDMEALSYIQDPWKVYLSVKPQLYNSDGSASNLTLDRHVQSINPTNEFHEYRFDWLPNIVNFFLDGQFMHAITTNVPSDAGRIIFNHWSDGNPLYGLGPPQQTAVLQIANVTMFYNSTSTPQPACSKMSGGCNASDIVQRRLLPATSLNPNYTSLYTSDSHRPELSVVWLALSIVLAIFMK